MQNCAGHISTNGSSTTPNQTCLPATASQGEQDVLTYMYKHTVSPRLADCGCGTCGGLKWKTEPALMPCVMSFAVKICKPGTGHRVGLVGRAKGSLRSMCCCSKGHVTPCLIATQGIIAVNPTALPNTRPRLFAPARTLSKVMCLQTALGAKPLGDTPLRPDNKSTHVPQEDQMVQCGDIIARCLLFNTPTN